MTSAGPAVEVALHEAAAGLIDATEGAACLADVGRIRGTSWVVLLAEEAGVPLDVARKIVGRGTS